MKQIFRYALLSNFTEKDELVTKEQLVQALKNTKNQAVLKDIDKSINNCTECIDKLVKIADKRDTETVLK